ncbi:MAG: glycosyltransferase [Mediterranea massiliensis]|nr:glycosyltransferase [Mediterranea massiliensis]
MKVLWFEVSMPACYEDANRVVTGWQDALENLVKTQSLDVELIIAFESSVYHEVKVIDGITYVPLNVNFSRFKYWNTNFWEIKTEKIIPKAVEIIKKIKPDIIHVFGTEWPFGLVANYTDIPVVIHIQGSMIPYNNALYPPGYNKYTAYKSLKWNLIKYVRHYLDTKHSYSRERVERKIWKSVKYYMGRTEWDKALANIMHPNCVYYHVDEALRPDFMNSYRQWEFCKSSKVKLLTIAHSGTWYWKGIDMLLKTAHIIKEMGIDFEWRLAGGIYETMKNTIEREENTTFLENNVHFLGLTSPNELNELLLDSTIYVHTSYVENSPNAICEAQYLGVPIVSTNVGGISSLCRNGKEATLVPANDPWQMANAIIVLSQNENLMNCYSTNSITISHKRHDYGNIASQLMSCYSDIISLNT